MKKRLLGEFFRFKVEQQKQEMGQTSNNLSWKINHIIREKKKKTNGL